MRWVIYVPRNPKVCFITSSSLIVIVSSGRNQLVWTNHWGPSYTKTIDFSSGSYPELARALIKTNSLNFDRIYIKTIFKAY